ncbi:MAG: Gfo/Idh/MocA family oxidoreductase [Candidatus Omnitrophica bacterium]|nr:Gfo/Idh/MocA family oxidoreductase [Candidatus Omnitrophota bacterium]
MNTVAVVGCGYWGPNLIRNFFQMPNVHLAALCDLNKGRLSKLAAQYRIEKITTDYRELIADSAIDAIVVATSVSTHYSIARDCLLGGKDVLVEKPLTFDAAQARELVDIAKKDGRILMVGHTFEFNPAVIKLKELIDSGELGDIYYVYSTRLNLGVIREDINAMWNLAPHDISILLFLLGNMPLALRAFGKSYLQKGIEDVVFATVDFPGNICAHIHVSWLDPSKTRKITVVGSRKMVVYDDINNEGKLWIYDKGVDKLVSEDGGYGEFQIKLRAGDLLVPKIQLVEPLRSECEHFIECVEKRLRPQTDGENGYRVVKILEIAEKSLKANGREMEVTL